MGQSSRCFVYLAANIKTFLCKVTTVNLKPSRQGRREGLGEAQAQSGTRKPEGNGAVHFLGTYSLPGPQLSALTLNMYPPFTDGGK